MGPLVPHIISNEFNLVMAFFIGICFGFILEQAGFSSTKKLVGLFYGYDFTVLRVFFTAGVTAMVGVLLLEHYGLLDTNIIYINPTFLWSALIGGVIMGAGFIVGGFCPGTSICALAIGKLDALAFIFGSLLGIFVFTEGYPLWENLFLAENWGNLLISEYLGISKPLFGFLLTTIAIAAFYFTWLIENKVNKRETVHKKKMVYNYTLMSIVPFVIIAIVAFLPSKTEIIQYKIAETKRQKKCVFREIESDKLAYEMVHNHYTINLIDVRPAEKFKEYHLPLAINIPLDSMKNREWKPIFKQQYKKNIFYADVDTVAKMACLLAKFIGKSDNYILKESSAEFRSMFFNISPPPSDALKEDLETYRFRQQTAMDLTNLVNSLKNVNQPIKRKIKKVQGGCS